MTIAPMHIRQLRAQMELKGISLKYVSAKSGVDYTTCSLILRGRLRAPERLKKIRSAIEKAPTAVEEVVA